MKNRFIWILGMSVLAFVLVLGGCDSGIDENEYEPITVSFSAGTGSGTPPSGKTVDPYEALILPGQEDMTAPGESIFLGWVCDYPSVFPSSNGGTPLWNTLLEEGRSVYFMDYGYRQSCTFTAVWEDVVVNESAIPDIVAPVTGETPVRSINAEQYTGEVEWSPSVSSTFIAETPYIATITLVPKTGYTFVGIEADFFTVEGASSASNSANSGIVTAVFSETDAVVRESAIPDIIPPVTGSSPVRTIDAEQYTGEIEWSPEVSSIFIAETPYIATITLTPKTGYTFASIVENFFTVEGASSVINDANSGVVTVTFPETDPEGAILRFYWTDEHGELASTDSNNGTVLSKSTADTMIISANDDEDYTNHRWYVNGIEDVSRAGESSYTFSSSVREVRNYTLTLFVENGNGYFNTTFNIKVVE
jgi:hypothetical protein